MGDTNNNKGFFTTLPGIITGLAGLVTAIGGLLLVLNQTGVLAPSPTAAAPVSPTEMVTVIPASTSTDPPAAISTPVPSPSSVEVEPKLVLSDPFGTNVNGWDTGEIDDEYGTINQRIVDGKYRWEVTAHQDIWDYGVPTVAAVSDFTLSVEAQRISGSEGSEIAGYGVMFRWVDSDNYYLFRIGDDQEFNFFLLENGERSTLIDWTSSSAIRPGEVNRLTVTAAGSHFVLSINDQIVGEADNGRLPSGIVGLVTRLYAGHESVFEFDNLELRAP